MKKVREITFRCPRIEVLDSRVESPVASLSNSLRCSPLPATSKVAGLKPVEALSENKGPPLLAPAPLLPLSGSPLALVPPQQRLQLLWDEHGARTALEMMFEITLPSAVPDELAEQVVEHFVNGKLLLPWALTSWWKPRHVSLPAAMLDDAVARRPEPLLPGPAGEERPASPYQRYPQSLPKGVKLSPGLPTSLKELPKPLWTAEDLAALEAVAGYLKKQDAALYVKYRPCFEPHAGVGGEVPPVLLGVIGAKDMKTGNPFNFVEEIFTTLQQLEEWWTVEYLQYGEEFPVEYGEPPTVFFGEFDSFDAPSPYASHFDKTTKTVSEDVMRKVWVRRVAVALWSDVNKHWPWALSDFPVSILGGLLGWHPEGPPTGSDTEDSGTVSHLLTGWHGENGQWLWKRAPGQYKSWDRTGYSVWSPDPFYEWQVAFYLVRPIMNEMQNVAPHDGVYATTQWLHDRGWTHDSAGVAAGGPWVPGVTTLKKLLDEGNCGGCHHTGALVASVLRAMNIPCLPMMTPTIGPFKAWKSTEIVLGDEHGHTSVVCRLAGGSLCVYHADYLCSYVGQRYGSPSSMWIPFAEWMLTQLVLVFCSSFLREEQGKEQLPQAQEILHLLTARWYETTIEQVKGLADPDLRARYSFNDFDNEYSHWVERLLQAVSDPEFGTSGKSWQQQVVEKLQVHGFDSGKPPPGWWLALPASEREELAHEFLRLAVHYEVAEIPVDLCGCPNSNPKKHKKSHCLLPREYQHGASKDVLVSAHPDVLKVIGPIADWLLSAVSVQAEE